MYDEGNELGTRKREARTQLAHERHPFTRQLSRNHEIEVNLDAGVQLGLAVARRGVTISVRLCDGR